MKNFKNTIIKINLWNPEILARFYGINCASIFGFFSYFFIDKAIELNERGQILSACATVPFALIAVYGVAEGLVDVVTGGHHVLSLNIAKHILGEEEKNLEDRI